MSIIHEFSEKLDCHRWYKTYKRNWLKKVVTRMIFICDNSAGAKYYRKKKNWKKCPLCKEKIKK